ncbi:MAG: lipoyl(octanoyl) transferase LipB [Cyanobacteria bacterium P01_D01_bin.105]
MEISQSQNGDLYLLGEVPYLTAWHWQKMLVHERRENGALKDAVLLLQHPPVYTLGHGADTRFLKFDLQKSNHEIHRIERGGEVTYHCPGQIVCYPILNLRRYRQDLHWYLRQLEEVVIRTLREYDLVGERISGLTGVWVNGRKVAAVGIKVSRWITMHGFALNVCPNLSGFEKIVPCGIEKRSVGSMAQFLSEVDLVSVQRTLIRQFEHVFGISFNQPLLYQDLQALMVKT